MNKHLEEAAIAGALRESEERFRVLVEGIALTIWETDPSGSSIVDSPSWRAFTGQAIGGVPALQWMNAIHPDDRECVRAHWSVCTNERRVFNAEYRLLRANGEWCWTQAHAAPLRDAEGRVRKWVGMNIDISQRKQAAHQLLKNERQMQLALDISRVSFWSLDPRMRCVRMDARMRAMWGETTDNEAIPLRTVLKRIHCSDRPLVVEAVNAALDPDGPGVYLPSDYRIVLDNGSLRWLSANGMTMFSGRGAHKHPIELFGTVLDITDRKLIEASLRESELRLQQLNTQLEDRVRERTQELVDSEGRLRAAAELAEQASRQLRRLALELSRTEERERRRLAQILHDHLQQLLVGAKMRVEGLARDGDLNAAKERLVGISTVIDIAIDTTRTLAVELAPPALHKQGLPTALQWLANQIRQQHGLSIELTAQPAANPASEESRDLLFQASRELLLNVIKHAQVKKAEVHLCIDGDDVVLQVNDDGVGFDPAQTADDAPTFGIFHLRERLTAVGGEIQIDSQIQHGTRVHVRLPRTAAEIR